MVGGERAGGKGGERGAGDIVGRRGRRRRERVDEEETAEVEEEEGKEEEEEDDDDDLLHETALCAYWIVHVKNFLYVWLDCR